MKPELLYVQTKKDFILKTRDLFIKTNMEERKKSINVNPAQIAHIKVTVVLELQVTEQSE